jgi:hypothetical protein
MRGNTVEKKRVKIFSQISLLGRSAVTHEMLYLLPQSLHWLGTDLVQENSDAGGVRNFCPAPGKFSFFFGGHCGDGLAWYGMSSSSGWAT